MDPEDFLGSEYDYDQQVIADKINSGQEDATFGPGSPDPTTEDKNTYVGGRYSPAGGFAVEGGVALPESEYYKFTPEQRRKLGIMDIGPEHNAGKIERYYGGPRAGIPSRDVAKALSDVSAEDFLGQQPVAQKDMGKAEEFLGPEPVAGNTPTLEPQVVSPEVSRMPTDLEAATAPHAVAVKPWNERVMDAYNKGDYLGALQQVDEAALEGIRRTVGGPIHRAPTEQELPEIASKFLENPVPPEALPFQRPVPVKGDNDSPLGQVAAGLLNAPADLLNFFVSPLGVAAPAIGFMGKTGQELVNRGFASLMFTDAVNAAREGRWQDMTENLLFGAGAAHGARESATEAPRTPSEPPEGFEVPHDVNVQYGPRGFEFRPSPDQGRFTLPAERRFILKPAPAEAPPQLAPVSPIETMLAGVGEKIASGIRVSPETGDVFYPAQSERTPDLVTLSETAEIPRAVDQGIELGITPKAPEIINVDSETGAVKSLDLTQGRTISELPRTREFTPLPTAEEFLSSPATASFGRDLPAEPAVTSQMGESPYSEVVTDSRPATPGEIQFGSNQKSLSAMYGIEPGTFDSAKTLISGARARLLSGKSDPYSIASRVIQGSPIDPHELADLVAEHERLRTVAADARKLYDSNPTAGNLDNLNAHRNAAETFAVNVIKPAGTQAGELLNTLRDVAPPDVTTLEGMRDAALNRVTREIADQYNGRLGRKAAKNKAVLDEVDKSVSKAADAADKKIGNKDVESKGQIRDRFSKILRDLTPCNP